MHRALVCFATAFEIARLLSACGPRVYDGAGGSSLPNGLMPEVYLQHQAELEVRMAHRVTSAENVDNLDSEGFASILGDGEDGLKLVGYAVGCAVTASLSYPATSTYEDGTFNGDAALTTTGGWITDSLDPHAKEDLHACIATRLNPTGRPVTIWLGGLGVFDKGVERFPIDEALWLADDRHANTEKVPRIQIWPFPAIGCANVEEAAKTRTCGTQEGCGLDVRHDMDHCKRDPKGRYLCPRTPGSCDCNHPESCSSGPDEDNSCREVIHTALRCDAWCSLYPGCRVPQDCEQDLGGMKSCPP